MAFDFPPGTEGLEFTPIAGLTYKYTTNRWLVKSQTSPGAAVIVSDNPPSNPAAGTFWWESDSGSLFIYYNDGNSSQWVQVNVPSDFTLAPNFVQKAGDTMSGDLSIVKAEPRFFMDKAAAGQAANITGRTASKVRWQIQLGTSEAESGSNAGSNFAINSYDDNGNPISSPVFINRATGLITLARGQIQFPATANPSSDVNTLDDYREGTWVPDLRLGGAAVGMTYSTRLGVYVKVGGLVNWWCYLVLSAKGTSTGNVGLGGLPFASVNNITYSAASIGYSVVTPVTVIPQASQPGGSASLNFYNQGGYLTDANITNATTFAISGSFQAA